MKNVLLLSTVLLSLLLQACGGSSDQSTTNDQTEVVTNPNLVSRYVELGPVKEATVSIQSLDGYEMISYTTSSDGSYEVDIMNLKQRINEYDSTLKYLRIVSKGGIDIDPNDDGLVETDEEKIVQGRVSGIIPVDKLLSNDIHSINLITTGVDNLLGNVINISDEQIIQVAEQIGAEDIDHSGELDIDDLIQYKMSENESRAETYLRTHLLNDLHEGNEESIKNIISSIKSEKSTISVQIVNKSEEELRVKLSNVPIGNYIQFGYKYDQSDVSFSTYTPNNDVYLQKDDVVYFQECEITGFCFKIQKLFFDGKDYFNDFLEYESKPILLENDENISQYKDAKEVLVNEITNLEMQLKEQQELIAEWQ